MDNASKALIMAGAILLAVAIIGIGIYIFSSANGIVNDSISSMDSLQAITFNQRFTVYMDKNVSGRTVKDFLDVVVQNNSSGNNTIIINYHTGGSTLAMSELTTASQIADLKKVINDGASYKIYPTNPCRHTNQGYNPDGTLGCITIKIQK